MKSFPLDFSDQSVNPIRMEDLRFFPNKNVVISSSSSIILFPLVSNCSVLTRYRNIWLALFLINSLTEPVRPKKKETDMPRKNSKIKPGFIPSGKPLKLREGVYNQLKEREWIFSRAEEGIIFLVSKSGAHGVAVKPGDIDWNEGSGA